MSLCIFNSKILKKYIKGVQKEQIAEEIIQEAIF